MLANSREQALAELASMAYGFMPSGQFLLQPLYEFRKRDAENAAPSPYLDNVKPRFSSFDFRYSGLRLLQPPSKLHLCDAGGLTGLPKQLHDGAVLATVNRFFHRRSCLSPTRMVNSDVE